jgi:hypothetical protein
MRVWDRGRYVYVIVLIVVMTTGIQAVPVQKEVEETWLNVFVHGIMSVAPHIGISNFIRFMTDNIEDTVYFDTVQLMREDSFFYENQAMQDIGLWEMDPTNKEPGNASGAMAVAFEKMSQFVNPDRVIENLYYTYGWSGLLSPSHRYYDAIPLYRSVAAKVDELKKMGKKVKVRIIGYSHGGNVVLNLALVGQCEDNPLPLVVDEVFLLGMPVQCETDFLVGDEIFLKIYHMYSRGDRIQKLDFFSFHRFFSHRLFKPRRGFQLPEKLLQIQLKCTRDVKSICNDPCKQAMNFKFENKSVQTGRASYLRDCSPGHTELWFFGWTPLNYRKHFSLYPFPSAVVVPLIARYVENFQERMRFAKPTLIDIRPQQEVVLVRNQKSKKVLVFCKFLPKVEMEQLAQEIMQYKPVDYNACQYNGHIHDALVQAQEMRVVKEHAKHCETVAGRHARKSDHKTRSCEHKTYKKECKSWKKKCKEYKKEQKKLSKKKS